MCPCERNTSELSGRSRPSVPSRMHARPKRNEALCFCQGDESLIQVTPSLYPFECNLRTDVNAAEPGLLRPEREISHLVTNWPQCGTHRSSRNGTLPRAESLLIAGTSIYLAER